MVRAGTRRDFIRMGGVGAAALLLGAPARTQASSRFASNPFTLGVASGDPWPDGVVLWTRLAPDPLAIDGPGGMTPRPFLVRYEIADDEGFRRVVRRGVSMARPELGHAVHAEVHGLRPDREYFYRFKAGHEISPVGRTKTAPHPHAAPSSLRFALASCQQWQAGFYTAYAHMAAEDLDLVVHVGDYIYESPINAVGGNRNQPVPEAFRTEPTTLARYRLQHALYKTDPDLQAAHAAFPWLVTWDDHEVDNNYAGAISQDNDDPQLFLARRAAAYQAFYEHIPLRRSSIPRGPDMQLYRSVRFGRLAQFNVLDERQFRSDQACGDTLTVPCEEAFDPARTMLGAEQERWLLDELARSRSTWNVVAQQVVMCRADRDPGPGLLLPMDNWNGYEPARQRLFDGVVERGVENFVVLTGDAHASMAADLKTDFADPASPVIGAEFLGTSIATGADGADLDTRGNEWVASNPHMKFYSARRGYVRCEVTPSMWRTDYRSVPFIVQPGAPLQTAGTFFVEAGTPGVVA
jgi:alkaline phosphatase D